MLDIKSYILLFYHWFKQNSRDLCVIALQQPRNMLIMIRPFVLDYVWYSAAGSLPPPSLLHRSTSNGVDKFQGTKFSQTHLLQSVCPW